MCIKLFRAYVGHLVIRNVLQASPTFPPKSPTFLQMCPVFLHKSLGTLLLHQSISIFVHRILFRVDMQIFFCISSISPSQDYIFMCCLYLCVYMHVHICVYVYVYVYVTYMYVCICVYVCVYEYIYIYTHIYTQTHVYRSSTPNRRMKHIWQQKWRTLMLQPWFSI